MAVSFINSNGRDSGRPTATIVSACAAGAPASQRRPRFLPRSRPGHGGTSLTVANARDGNFGALGFLREFGRVLSQFLNDLRCDLADGPHGVCVCEGYGQFTDKGCQAGRGA